MTDIRESLQHHLFSQLRDARSIGCHCQIINRRENLSVGDLETLIVNITTMSKLKKRRYIIGELAASSAPTQPASVVRKLIIAYTVLDNFVCHTVFLEVPQIPRSVLKPPGSVFENVSIMQ